jgi:hypothetical protein
VVVGVLLATGLSQVVSAPPAAACDCTQVGDVEAFAHADAVFVGTVVSPAAVPTDVVWSSTDPGAWVFDVQSVYKGSVAPRQTVWSPLSGASCGLELEKDESRSVVVFAGRDTMTYLPGFDPPTGELHASLCGGTRLLTDGTIPTSFGEPKPPGAAETPSTSAESVAGAVGLEHERDPWVVWGAGALGLSIAAALTALVLHRRVRP